MVSPDLETSSTFDGASVATSCFNVVTPSFNSSAALLTGRWKQLEIICLVTAFESQKVHHIEQLVQLQQKVVEVCTSHFQFQEENQDSIHSKMKYLQSQEKKSNQNEMLKEHDLPLYLKDYNSDETRNKEEIRNEAEVSG
nr:hypothetical protein Iba_chr07bCG15790 [Ipomoea batatas]